MNNKSILLVAFASLLPLPCPALSAETTVDSATILRIEQRDVSGSGKQDILPATQFLGLDTDKLGDGNLSLHLYGWGRFDLGDKSFNNDRADGNLTYGYLQYRFKQANSDIRLGRFFVHEGIANEQVDGLSARSDLPAGFGISAFGGATVHTRHLFNENSDGKGDGLVGGRADYRYKGMLELGLSGVYESAAPALVHFTNGSHRLLGGDIWLNPHRMVTAMGHTSYNTETNRVAEHSYLINLKPCNDLTLTAGFNEQRDRSFFYAWTMFSGAALNPADKSRSMGGSASYAISREVELTIDYKHYTRELGNADRLGGDVRLTLMNNSLRSGLAYHYLRAGDEFAISGTQSASYHQARAYAMQDTKGYFCALDVLGYFFNKKVFNEDSAWEVVGSVGYHLTPALALSGDISYGRNPEFTEETRGLLRLTYNMTFEGSGVKK
jgi:hypothetical protein